MSVLVAAPILLTLTLIASSTSKFGQRESIQDAMTSLRLPLRRTHGAVAAVLPVAEFVLAVLLWSPLVPLATIAAALTALLMVAYLVIIARALTFEEEVTCSCFGSFASPTVSRTTLWRNLLLTALGVLAVIAAASGRTSQAVTQTPLTLLGWALALSVAAVLTVAVLGGVESSAATPVAAPTGGDEGAEEDELLDYERAPIPAAVLQQPDGELITLRRLAGQQAALLLFATEGCGPCERVLDQVPGWVTELAPFMQVKVAFSRPLDQLRERTGQRVGEHALHDLQFSAREALGASGAPSAVLLGADGLLAGGPVRGSTEVIDLVEQIQEQLRIAQSEGELPRQDSHA